ncbi:putative Glycosyltransferase family 92, nucleotide-diphospho-sugar transferase [Helianthus annuus]|uniref:Glycosyltransferase family 92 protein n=1 Tax=Helianthus annuus TaxID=4232 RepID=A0A251UP57_HELAN|nr:glycosyltransferase family 92 protein Os08g0121900 [Helianthus annuus]KAF5805775.1 putative Glycosyltransferase family 92, nucleotide-diphospho-sugar transferase [Helianthus annuus]KAJ0584482.1 putative Glycosyltransferase family 92, nucleotide-diphospho-sugar transferase [Helianthus annuus]KAJ0750156.1 putative Glycosyltransferase family 92, nucleotide-diphospho-sugar transferase [Helianthus annuus]KAJ0918854.1 putative Glycosyltransferase family 92, nucleotide-diphospho-sugar transferase [
MALKIRTFFLYVSISIVSFTATYHLLSPTVSDQLRRRPPVYFPNPRLRPYASKNHIINEQDTITSQPSNDVESETLQVHIPVNNDSMRVFRKPDLSIANVSVLFPSWEALVIVSNDVVFDRNYTTPSSLFCLFDTDEISPARFTGTMSFPDRNTYTCPLPKRVLRRLPFRQPVLTKTPVQSIQPVQPAPELLRWNFIVYEIVETENDVVLLAKGINNRQGVNRSPTEFKCLFGDDIVNGVTTSVTSSVQEVFRCQRPELTEFGQNLVRVSLLIVQNKQVVPSLAYYTPQRKIAIGGTKSLLCACTMVYNVAKFLKEWVIYHSKIGVDKFILYDNGSDDDLEEVVDLLKSKGYDVETRFWLWPKTQEGGFSHAVLHAKTMCRWMMFIDVDEFVYSPSWASSKPSKSLLQSLLPTNLYGQLIIRCYEFGPSNQTTHPLAGVTQGYTCRKEIENRHKSIVLLDAIHESLLNVIHHFKLKDGYKSKKANIGTVVVNHYKYQAWPEFKAKFRRRVSAYVVDWTRSVNLKSNDRAPGLGYLAVEPKGWEERFCEVYDNRLKHLTRRWFGSRKGQSEFGMIWQNI